MENHENHNINQLPDTNPRSDSIMPEIRLFDPYGRIRRMLGGFVSKATEVFSFLPTEPLSTVSDHFQRTQEERDLLEAERMLSIPEAREAYEQLRIEFDARRDWRQYPDMADYPDEHWDVV